MNTLIDHLPSIPALRQRCQALAMLDAILSPEWDYRYYSYNQHWATHEEMASMRDGCGNEWFLLFDCAGAAIKGFDHEQSQSDVAANIKKELPPSFASFINEPAFSMHNATFCYWRSTQDTTWHKVSGPNLQDSSIDLVALLIESPLAYKEWAEDYYEVSLPLDIISAIYQHEPLTEKMIQLLNQEIDATLDTQFWIDQVNEIGYPSSVYK
jgi:hypothetical protein